MMSSTFPLALDVTLVLAFHILWPLHLSTIDATKLTDSTTTRGAKGLAFVEAAVRSSASSCWEPGRVPEF